MSVYNNRIKTHLIKPVYNGTNLRSEFRLESDTAYLSNMRLMDIGVTKSASQTQYNALVGAYGVIKSIHLYDNNTLLDQTLEASLWLAWKQVNKGNQDNQSSSFMTAANNASNVLAGNDDVLTGLGKNIIGGAVFQLLTATTEVNTSKGWLNLREVFPMLKSLQFLDTSVFKRLRVVIHYHSDPTNYLKDEQSSGICSSTEPLLVVDEIIGDGKAKVMGKFKGVNYTVIEHDRVRVPSIGGTGGSPAPTKDQPIIVQSNSFKIGGFNNKSVGRMLIVKSPVDPQGFINPAGNGTNIGKAGKYMSVAMNKEIVQLRKNGNALLTGRGLESSSQRLAMVNDIWGQSSIPPFHNGLPFVTNIANEDKLRDLLVFNNQDVGTLDYIAFDCRGEQTNDLQLEYERSGIYVYKTTPKNQTEGTDVTATGDSIYNASIDLNIFAEVDKSIVVQGGNYQVVYA